MENLKREKSWQYAELQLPLYQKEYRIEEQQGQRPPTNFLRPQAAVTTENVLCVISSHSHSLTVHSRRGNNLIQCDFSIIHTTTLNNTIALSTYILIQPFGYLQV